MASSVTYRKASIFVDAHVHIHDVFDLYSFLDAATRNFSAQVEKTGETGSTNYVLCLTETQDARKFENLRSLLRQSSYDVRLDQNYWQVHSTDEPHSLRLDHSQRGTIYIIAGRQIVSAEHLEVLALGCETHWKDGQPASEIISRLNRTCSVPVLPWGFGKWYGKRGKVIMSLMRAHRDQILFLGDNSGRPSILPRPRHFKTAEKMGINILPGTDPLPFADEQTRAGLSGFTLPEPLDENRPWNSIRRQITSRDAKVTPYGDLESPWRFAKNQVAMQLHIRERNATSKTQCVR